MLLSLFLVTFPNKLLYFVCIQYFGGLTMAAPVGHLLLNLINLGLLYTYNPFLYPLDSLVKKICKDSLSDIWECQEPGVVK